MKALLLFFVFALCSTVFAQEIDLKEALSIANSDSTCKFEIAETDKIGDCDTWDLSLIEKSASCARVYVKSEHEEKIYLLFQQKEGEMKYIIRVQEEEPGENIYITSRCPF